MRLLDAREGRRTGTVAEAVRGGTHRCEDVPQVVVLGGEAADERLGGGCERRLLGAAGAQRAQRVEDDCDVNALLQQRADGRLEQTESGRGHGGQ